MIVFASLVAAYNEGDACYASDPDVYGYYAPHPVYCYRFLQCTHGRFISRNCSPGLHWSVKEGACAWPHDANCDGLTTQRTTTTTTEGTTTGTTYYPTTDTTQEYESTYYTDSTYYTES